MIGLVVMGGVALATLVTLFLVPMAYSLMARGTGSKERVSRKLDAEIRELESAPAGAGNPGVGASPGPASAS